MNWTEVIAFFATFLVTTYGQRFLQNRNVRHAAKQMLESTEHPVTDIKQAVQEALVTAHYKQWAPQVDALVKQQAEGKLRVAAAIDRQKQATAGVIESTIVPRDGTEEWK